MPKTVKQTMYGADLDITGYKTLDKEKLQKHILDDVKDTQIIAGRHLPDKLFLTFPQFHLLEEDMQRLGETEYRIYATPYNVMEVHVVDAPEFVDVEALTGELPDDEKDMEATFDEEFTPLEVE